MRQGLEKGKLSFTLRGRKLRGSWTLVKTTRSPKDWLLIKHRDAHADGQQEVLEEDRSVQSGLTIDDLKGGRLPDPKSAFGLGLFPQGEGDHALGTEERFPSRMKPMMAGVARKPFSGPDWLFEPKLDGFPVVAYVRPGNVTLLTRNGIDITTRLPDLVADLESQPVEEMVLDGEIVAGVVTTPFSFEGTRRIGEAIAGVSRLRPFVDNLIVIHNDRLLQYVSHDAEMIEAFRTADEVVTQGILSVSELINVPGEINVDFADVRSIMLHPGGALMAMGRGCGKIGALEVAGQAIANPLLNLSIKGAEGVLFSVKGGAELTLGGVNAAGELIGKSVRKDASIFFGMSIDENMEDSVKLTMIATGLKDKDILRSLGGKVGLLSLELANGSPWAKARYPRHSMRRPSPWPARLFARQLEFTAVPRRLNPGEAVDGTQAWC